MARVFVSVGMSIDGYLVPPGLDFLRMGDPASAEGLAQWSALHAWLLPTRTFRQRLKFGDDGETGPDDDRARRTFDRTGVTILGRRMFDHGEGSWPEEAPFHTPVFVVTHRARAPWERPGGTTFRFVDDGIHSALNQARAVVGDRDIRIGGGADLIVQYLNAGLVDELHLAVAPVLFGGGTPLFAGIDHRRVALTPADSAASPRVTHLSYAVSLR
ncbi:MAG: dihydrofolate reductase family protein [Myxococcota bacterium]